MKTLTFILLLVVAFMGCSDNSTEAEPKPSALITNIRLQQDYYEYSQTYGNAYIYFDIKNTGRVDIDYWEAYFEVTLINEGKYTTWTNGTNLTVGATSPEYDIMNTNGIKAVSVKFISIKYSVY